MSVTAAAGILGFAPQAYKSDDPSYVEPTALYRHYAADIDYGPAQEMKPIPPEIGNVPLTFGMYKAGVSMTGGATIHPRLAGDAGHLFRAALGGVTSTPGTGSPAAVHAAIAFDATSPVNAGFTNPPSARRLLFTPTGVTGGNITITTIVGTDDTGAALTDNTAIVLTTAAKLSAKKFKTVTSVTFTKTASAGSFTIGYNQTYSHKFAFATDPESLPWMLVRKIIPGSTKFGEQGTDNKITSARFTLQGGGLLQARLDFMGRVPAWQEGADLETPGTGWLNQWYSGFESFDSIPLTADVLTGFTLPNYSPDKITVTNVVVAIGNNLSSPDQERIIGSPYMDDVATLFRNITFQATLKWKDASLYKKMMLGDNTTAQGWSTKPFETDLSLALSAPIVIPGTSTRYSLTFAAPSVVWSVNAPPQLQAGNILSLPVLGTVIVPTSGDAFTATLVNEYPEYA